MRDQILGELKSRIGQLKTAGRPPGLAVALIGEDPASAIYVRNKVKACAELGINSEARTCRRRPLASKSWSWSTN